MRPVFNAVNAAFISNSAPLVYYLQTQRFFHLKTPPVTFLRVQRVPGEGSAAGLRPSLHEGTHVRGRPFVRKAACTGPYLGYPRCGAVLKTNEPKQPQQVLGQWTHPGVSEIVPEAREAGGVQEEGAGLRRSGSSHCDPRAAAARASAALRRGWSRRSRAGPTRAAQAAHSSGTSRPLMYFGKQN